MTTRDMTFVALFAALTAACAVFPPFQPPFVPAPIIVQNIGVMLAGSILGAKRGSLSLLLFVVLVAVGMPILSGWRGGFGVILGPTGGFILSWIAAAYVVGWLVEKNWKRLGFWNLLLFNVIGGIVRGLRHRHSVARRHREHGVGQGGRRLGDLRPGRHREGGRRILRGAARQALLPADSRVAARFDRLPVRRFPRTSNAARAVALRNPCRWPRPRNHGIVTHARRAPPCRNPRCSQRDSGRARRTTRPSGPRPGPSLPVGPTP